MFVEEVVNMLFRLLSRDFDLLVVLLLFKFLRGYINRLFKNRYGYVYVKCIKSILEIYLENIVSVNVYIIFYIYVI